MRIFFILIFIIVAYQIIKLVFKVWIFSRKLKKQAQETVSGEKRNSGRVIEDAEFTEIKDDKTPRP